MHSTGILNVIQLPYWATILCGLLILDLVGAWLVHWMEHKVKWMWRFHVIHHSDQYVDVTSGLRHHPGESIFRLLFTSLAVFVSGASFGIVMLYQTLSGFFAHLTHTNIRAINFLEPILSKILVTPNFHKIHHHYVLPHTDRNYGNIFSIWDHLFGTTIKIDNMDMLTYGIDTHMDKKETEDIKTMLLIPFKEYRRPVGAKFDNK
jgi:sterol desaturase/sphingolipid hydroxylase (fatty acid hydroxylase superfamily)